MNLISVSVHNGVSSIFTAHYEAYSLISSDPDYSYAVETVLNALSSTFSKCNEDFTEEMKTGVANAVSDCMKAYGAGTVPLRSVIIPAMDDGHIAIYSSQVHFVQV